MRYNHKEKHMEEEVKEVVKEDVVDSAQQQEAVQEQETASPETETVEKVKLPEVSEPQVSNDLDEYGVPWKNRAMEYKRKMEKEQRERTESQQNQQINQQPQRENTIPELEAFALDAENPAHKQWAMSEIERLRDRKYQEMLDKKLASGREQQQVETLKTQTFNSVISRNPDLVIKDEAGNFKGWNANNVVFKKINQYMQNPEIANHPRALEIAEAYAKRDLFSSQAPVINNKLEKQANALKSLQKKTLIEGAGNQTQQSISTKSAAIDKLKQTGSSKDARSALGEVFRSQGIIKD